MSVDLGTYGNPDDDRRRLSLDRIGRAGRPSPLRVAAVAIAVLLIAQVATLATHAAALRSASADPRTAASAMFAAVGRGDATAAAGYLATPAGATRFTDADLRLQTAATDPHVLSVSRSGSRAVVTVGYALLGHPARSTLSLTRRSGGLLGAPRWLVTGGLPVLHVWAPSDATAVSVDGRPLALRGGAADVTVFPGVLGLRLAADLPAASADDLVMASGSGAVERLVPDADPAVVREVEDAVSSQVLPGLMAAWGGETLFPSLPTIDLESDGRTLVFIGHVVGVSGSGAQVKLRTLVQILGTARYAAGLVHITAVQTFA